MIANIRAGFTGEKLTVAQFNPYRPKPAGVAIDPAAEHDRLANVVPDEDQRSTD